MADWRARKCVQTDNSVMRQPSPRMARTMPSVPNLDSYQRYLQVNDFAHRWYRQHQDYLQRVGFLSGG